MASERILIVDTEQRGRAIIASILENAHYYTVTASNGPEAIQHLRKDPPYDLVLSDIMGENSGLALLEDVRELQPDTPVLMATDPTNARTAIHALRKGAFDCLLKPVEMDQLLLAVRNALNYRRTLLQSSVQQSNLEQVIASRTDMLRRAVADLERSYDITLEALGDALDLKDAETEGHSKRVTAYTVALARAMGLAPSEIRIIARGAFLHDIGKMAIPDAILLKPGKLTSDEQALMREHCVRGYQILSKIPYLREAAEIVYTHQEHYNGSGYPRSLKGNEIPLGSRIFAVADTLDAITSDRPYRRAQSIEIARREIQRCSGTQFDPKVVDVYLSMPNRLWMELRREISLHPRFSSVALSTPELKS
jgi:putative nucleotidyltransferase with HDIG domain